MPGQPAPAFALPALQGGTVELAAYHGRCNVLLWFSRGFTCPFCRTHMAGFVEGYERLRAAETEVIQVAPNLVDGARSFFGESAPPYPFVCDPDKRLYAVYGLGDRGALEATRSAVVSFGHALAHGDGTAHVRGAWADVANRNFLRRLHHHAVTALEQGVFVIDRQGLIRHRFVVGPIDALPAADQLLRVVRAADAGVSA
jgi:peroxiredoxin